MFNKKDQDNKRFFVRSNEQIRIPQVMVIQDGNNLGVMATRDAVVMARNCGMDLVEVAPFSKPPVCHIRDYGDYVFELKKKKKAQSKNHGSKEKEITFRYVIGDHDLETKMNQIKTFLSKGLKVKCTVKFKEREKAHKNLGIDLLNKLVVMLEGEATAEKAPAFEGGSVFVILSKHVADKYSSR